MYLLNAPVEITWQLPKDSIIDISELDIFKSNPAGDTEYINQAISSENYTPATATTYGYVKYSFTPNIEGLWKIQLARGSSDLFDVLSKSDIFVLDNTLLVSPLRYLNGLVVDEKSLSQPGFLQVVEGNIRWYPTKDIQITEISASVGETAFGSDILIDVKKNGISILNNPIRIIAETYRSQLIVPSNPLLTTIDYVTVDVVQVGSSIPGKNLVVNFKYE